ncbi:MAG: DUF3800 domain-containing protein [Nitrospirae bacterium]|nr:DUF3800 domain-containing protein [Nitrospirota bacterium]MDE3039157.1 DUF3800 domain-containing protein [Nitrospirota bacterium]MDE3220629.1 DUF3800 domain-containing protein [Nitrospirota bacterium]
MYIAFFDESGNPSDKEVVTLAGFVAPAKKWEKFESSWKRILRRHKVPFFHLTDYNRRKPPYDNWSEDNRISFTSDLAAITKNAIILGSAHSVVVKDWNEVVVPFFATKKLKRRSWYVFLQQGVLEDIVKYVKLPRGEQISCVFDRNHDMDSRAIEHYNELIKHRGWGEIFKDISFEDKTRFVPLQAADMLAGLARQRVEEKVVQGSFDQEGKLLANLCANSQITLARYSKERLIELKDKWAAIRNLLVANNNSVEDDES